jgi:hypothetical protein
MYGDIYATGSVNAFNLHATSSLTVDGATTFTNPVTMTGNQTGRLASFIYSGADFSQFNVRNDDTASSLPVVWSNHGIAGIGGGVQQRATLARGNASTGQFASMIETKATADWSNAANQTAEMNLWAMVAGNPTSIAKIDSAGISTALAIRVNNRSTAAGIGYSPGTGGVINQSTSKATTVALNILCGRIVMSSGGGGANSIPAGGTVAFNYTNTLSLTTDIVVIKQADNAGATFGAYAVFWKSVSAGNNQIVVRNLTAAALDEPVALEFMIFRAATT